MAPATGSVVKCWSEPLVDGCDEDGGCVAHGEFMPRTPSPGAPEEVTALTEVRLARQAILSRPERPLKPWTVIDEAVLHQRFSDRPHISIRRRHSPAGAARSTPTPPCVRRWPPGPCRSGTGSPRGRRRWTSGSRAIPRTLLHEGVSDVQSFATTRGGWGPPHLGGKAAPPSAARVSAAIRIPPRTTSAVPCPP
jgi:hypothetical protein